MSHSRLPTRRDSSFEYGTNVETLTDEQLLSLFLRRDRLGAQQDAAKLLELGGGLDGLARLSPSVLVHHVGIHRDEARLLCAAFELGQRRGLLRRIRYRIHSVASVLDWARPHLLTLDHEEVWLLCLDARNVLRNSRRVAQGGLHCCALSTHDILRPALRDGASSIVLVHNHPSGDPVPSEADIAMTADIDVACAAVGLPLLDHVVVAAEGASSMLELGVVGSK